MGDREEGGEEVTVRGQYWSGITLPCCELVVFGALMRGSSLKDVISCRIREASR